MRERLDCSAFTLLIDARGSFQTPNVLYLNRKSNSDKPQIQTYAKVGTLFWDGRDRRSNDIISICVSIGVQYCISIFKDTFANLFHKFLYKVISLGVVSLQNIAGDALEKYQKRRAIEIICLISHGGLGSNICLIEYLQKPFLET